MSGTRFTLKFIVATAGILLGGCAPWVAPGSYEVGYDRPPAGQASSTYWYRADPPVVYRYPTEPPVVYRYSTEPRVVYRYESPFPDDPYAVRRVYR